MAKVGSAILKQGSCPRQWGGDLPSEAWAAGSALPIRGSLSRRASSRPRLGIGRRASSRPRLGIIPALAVEVTHSMAATRDSLNTSASCTLPAVPLHWQYSCSWGLDHIGPAGQEAAVAQGAAGSQGAAGFSPRGPSDGATAGEQSRDRLFWTSRSAVKGERAGPAPTSPERQRNERAPIASAIKECQAPTSPKRERGDAARQRRTQEPHLPSRPTSPERERAGLPSIHGAGGTLDPLESRQGQVGGLLAVEAPQAVGDPLRHWYFYDGNGNVGQLLAYDATGPTVNAAPAAHYEYDPYGQLVNWTDTLANPFRFSTKWFDAETGLGYWGYRYLSVASGRWATRDPLGEAGGGNLYAYVNSPGNCGDPLGLEGHCWYRRNPFPTEPRVTPIGEPSPVNPTPYPIHPDARNSMIWVERPPTVTWAATPVASASAAGIASSVVGGAIIGTAAGVTLDWGVGKITGKPLSTWIGEWSYNAWPSCPLWNW